MVVELKNIEALFVRLLGRSISREEAQKQAMNIRYSHDAGNLEFYPTEYEDKIWDAVQFIELFAEKVDETTYLYAEIDLLAYLREKYWDIQV